MVNSTILVGIGSGLGGLARFGLAVAFTGAGAVDYLASTLLANVAGCLLIGWLGARLSAFSGPRALAWKVFSLPGFCGGFTTVSLFGRQSMELLQNGDILVFVLYLTGSLIGCMGGVVLGWKAAKGSESFHDQG